MDFIRIFAYAAVFILSPFFPFYSVCFLRTESVANDSLIHVSASVGALVGSGFTWLIGATSARHLLGIETREWVVVSVVALLVGFAPMLSLYSHDRSCLR